MINNFYLKILDFLINLIDLTNRIKIISFLKKKTLNKKLVIFDVGAHKGETLKIFKNNFNFEKILCFEPNKKIFKTLIKKYDYLKNSNIFFINCGLSDKIELKQLNVLQDTSSSTFSKINEDSAYFRRKKKIIDLFSTNAFYKKVNVNVKTISYFISAFFIYMIYVS